MKADTTSNISKTDWARIDAMTDEDIDTSDIPPLGEDFFTKAKIRMPPNQSCVSVEVDATTLAWYQIQRKCQKQMSVPLKCDPNAQRLY
ncbi:hypothetical protein RIF25_04630 [Thermosynechococcaceae cyanobacterium BACA0444]|uniref:Uncharacterized protein n=1 Tax=Pseudocalidococcus azoricus BACA0444 TaxID=2918990 RepID=A0AAE4FQ47_9CYAN|nr:hypothetical protein [Pseudocalidococcus azoricus]MDS3860090.1 hypothetical protein [Pseudocalidococcus azoricus BACA0444]